MLDSEKLRNALLLGKEMREAQRAYFRARKSGLPGQAHLENSKELERRFDRMIDDYFNPKLF